MYILIFYIFRKIFLRTNDCSSHRLIVCSFDTHIIIFWDILSHMAYFIKCHTIVFDNYVNHCQDHLQLANFNNPYPQSQSSIPNFQSPIPIIHSHSQFKFKFPILISNPLSPIPYSDQQDWVYTLEADTETFSSLVSSSRLRPRLKFLES